MIYPLFQMTMGKLPKITTKIGYLVLLVTFRNTKGDAY